MEDSISRPNERIEDVKGMVSLYRVFLSFKIILNFGFFFYLVIDFAIKAAKHLSDHKWECYDESTIAQLELFL